MENFDLKGFRRGKKLSQTQLAELLDIGQSFVSQIENEKDPMPESLIEKLIDIFGNSDIERYRHADKNTVHGTQSIAGNGNTVSGNVNITLPDKGYQKIIRSDGSQTTLEVASPLAENEYRDLASENMALQKEVSDLKNKIIELQGRLLDGK